MANGEIDRRKFIKFGAVGAAYLATKPLGLVGGLESTGAAELAPGPRKDWMEHPETGPLDRFSHKTPEEAAFIDTILRGEARGVDMFPYFKNGKSADPNSFRAERQIGSGSNGAFVVEAQQRLAYEGFYPWEQIDGAFGPKTHAAVSAFQQKYSIGEGGIVGPTTWTVMADWVVPPNSGEGQRIVIHDGLRRIWAVAADGHVQYTGAITNNIAAMNGAPVDDQYKIADFYQTSYSLTESRLPLPYALHLGRTDDGGRFQSRQILVHCWPLEEAGPDLYNMYHSSIAGLGPASLGSPREDSIACKRVSPMGAKILGNLYVNGGTSRVTRM